MQSSHVKFLIFHEQVLKPMQSLVHLVVLLILTVTQKGAKACLHLRFVLGEVSKHLEQAGQQVRLALIGKWDVRNLDAV
jgi:hypothetical protein